MIEGSDNNLSWLWFVRVLYEDCFLFSLEWDSCPIWPSAAEDADFPERQTSGLLAQREEDEETQFPGLCRDVQVRVDRRPIGPDLILYGFPCKSTAGACCCWAFAALVVSGSSKTAVFSACFCSSICLLQDRSVDLVVCIKRCNGLARTW